MTLKLRQKIERNIVELVVRSAIEAGYELSVDDGEEITLKRSRDRAAIMNALFTTDEDRLWFSRPGDASIKGSPKMYHGWVFFVYGNDGHYVINDYTTNLENVLKKPNLLADKYADLFN